MGQQGQEQRQQILRHLRIPRVGRMHAIRLHAARNPVYALQQKRQQRHVVFGCHQRVSLVELADVVGPIVGRQGDAAQHHLGARMKQRRDDLGNPRKPSLPPNATMPSTGFSRKASSSRSTPSLVVFPLIPWLTTWYG